MKLRLASADTATNAPGANAQEFTGTVAMEECSKDS
jgi:hypothetical protein